MTTTSRLGRQITELVSALDRANVRFALIGGLALVSHNVVIAPTMPTERSPQWATNALIAAKMPETTHGRTRK